MDQQPTPDEIRDQDPERFDKALTFFREMAGVSSDILTEISVALLRDPRMQKRVDRDSNKSEEQMMEQINKGLKVFLGTVPLALLNGINPLMTIISSHSLITKDPFLAAIVAKISEENLAGDDSGT